jgi:hypothetical protein
MSGFWTEHKQDMVRKWYHIWTTKRLSKCLGCTQAALRSEAFVLGLCDPPVKSLEIEEHPTYTVRTHRCL